MCRSAVFRKADDGIRLQVFEGAVLLAELLIEAKTCSHIYTDCAYVASH
jgi:hypothetical protein